MGICRIVSDAAGAIAAAKPEAVSSYRQQLAILRDMPAYADARDLGTWERAFMSSVDERILEAEVGELLWSVFEFGRFNLYSRIREAETAAELEHLLARLHEHGISFTAATSAREW